MYLFLDCIATLKTKKLKRAVLGDKARPTIVRSSVDVAVTPTIVEYLTELGARLEFEYAARGYMFRKGRMKITVFKINPVSIKLAKSSEF